MREDDPLEIPDGDIIEGEIAEAATSAVVDQEPTEERYRVGSLIRSYRRYAGWSQADLARETDIEKAVIVRIEGGATMNPQNWTLERIASALARHFEHLSAGELLQDFIDAKQDKPPRHEADPEAKQISARLRLHSTKFKRLAYDAISKLLDTLEDIANTGP